uniref:Peptidase C-terminal archaeal/bacterial domain-containing protein n=1 Tax=Aplanochytrium stocchinoi TaxID=215587 RepID=A0A6S8B671_9STRA
MQTFFGSLDHDLYHVDLVAGYLYQFNIDTPVQLKLSRANSEAVLLRDASEPTKDLLSSVDAWVIRDFEKGITEFSFTPEITGKYYFEVSRAFPFSVPGLFGEYVSPDTRYGVRVIDDDFPAGISTTEELTAFNGTISGRVNSPGDRDWFAIELVANETLNVVLESENSLKTSVHIRDSNGNLLQGDDAWLSFSSAAGAYQLRGSVFAVMSGSTCTGFIPCFDGPLSGISTSSAFAILSEEIGTMHSQWTQLISLHNAYYIDIVIMWSFRDNKTLRGRFESAIVTGENVTWQIHNLNTGEVLLHEGIWRFASGIAPEDVCSSGILSKGGAAFGTSNSTVDGSQKLPDDFYGHGTFSATTLKDCGKYYSNGIQDISSFVVSRLALNAPEVLVVPRKQHTEFLPENTGLYFIDVGGHGFSTGKYCLDVTGESSSMNMSACLILSPNSPADDPDVSPKGGAPDSKLRKSQIINISVGVLFFAIIAVTIAYFVVANRSNQKSKSDKIPVEHHYSKRGRGALMPSKKEAAGDDQDHSISNDYDNFDLNSEEIKIDLDVEDNKKILAKKRMRFDVFKKRRKFSQEINSLGEQAEDKNLEEDRRDDDQYLPDNLFKNGLVPDAAQADFSEGKQFKRGPHEPDEPFPGGSDDAKFINKEESWNGEQMKRGPHEPFSGSDDVKDDSTASHPDDQIDEPTEGVDVANSPVENVDTVKKTSSGDTDAQGNMEAPTETNGDKKTPRGKSRTASFRRRTKGTDVVVNRSDTADDNQSGGSSSSLDV